MQDAASLNRLFLDADKLDSLIANRLLEPATANSLAAYAANTFFNHFNQTGDVLSRAVLVLSQLATSQDAGVAQAGLQGLFPLLTERLSDAFTPSFCDLYDRAFSEVIRFCGRHPSGGQIDKALTRFGLQSNNSFMVRKNSRRDQMPFNHDHAKQYRKCILLSRVTLGAEVAVTSMAIAKLLEVFPNAEVILIGDKKFADIFYEVPRLHVRHCRYPAGGGLLERIQGWIDALAIVDNEIRDLPESAYIVIDPDSRFTQLGLLPLVENQENYLFFESRSFQHPQVEKISELMNCWLKLHFGGSDVTPFINLPGDARDYARRLRVRLTAEKNILTGVSLGVGGNEKKRLGPAFELALLKKLLDFKNNTVLLFKGVGAKEIERTSNLLQKLSDSSNKRILSISGNDPRDLPALKQTDVIAWEGPLSEYGALIAELDIQVGYDSSSQHIAAACGVPTIDIFVDESTPMFVKRWAPHGPGPVGIVRTFEIADRVAPQDLEQRTPDFALSLEGTDPKLKIKSEKGLEQTIEIFNELLEKIGRA